MGMNGLTQNQKDWTQGGTDLTMLMTLGMDWARLRLTVATAILIAAPLAQTVSLNNHLEFKRDPSTLSLASTLSLITVRMTTWLLEGNKTLPMVTKRADGPTL